MPIEMNFDIGGARRRKKERTREIFDTYLKNNPDMTLGEVAEIEKSIEKNGRFPQTLASGRDPMGLTLAKRKAYFRRNKDSGLIEPVDMGEDVAAGRVSPEFMDFDPDGSDAPGRVITMDEETGKLSFVNPQGEESPLTEDSGFGGLRRTDKVVRKPRPRAAGETPEEKAMLRAIEAYNKAKDDYDSPADIPEQIVTDAADAARGLGMPTKTIDIITKRRGRIAKLFGKEDEVGEREVPDFSGGGEEGGGDRRPASDDGYTTEEDVRKAYRGGKITREKAMRILQNRFKMQ